MPDTSDSTTSLMSKFEARRNDVARENRDRFETFEAGWDRLPVFLVEAWPESAAALADESVSFREVGHGHDLSGALAGVVYSIGNEAIGRRVFSLRWDDVARTWTWRAR